LSNAAYADIAPSIVFNFTNAYPVFYPLFIGISTSSISPNFPNKLCKSSWVTVNGKFITYNLCSSINPSSGFSSTGMSSYLSFSGSFFLTSGVGFGFYCDLIREGSIMNYWKLSFHDCFSFLLVVPITFKNSLNFSFLTSIYLVSSLLSSFVFRLVCF
jgi:hypothetical protein